jgi:hypothetical protein
MVHSCLSFPAGDTASAVSQLRCILVVQTPQCEQWTRVDSDWVSCSPQHPPRRSAMSPRARQSSPASGSSSSRTAGPRACTKEK